MGHLQLLLHMALAIVLAATSHAVYIVEGDKIESNEIYDNVVVDDHAIEDEKETVHKDSEVPEAKPGLKLECNLTPEQIAEIRSYEGRVNQIIEYVVNGPHKGKTYDTLATMVDQFGPRQSGSKSLVDAIEYMQQISIDHGLDNVHTEDVTVPHWVRNNESAWMTSPRLHRMNILGLGSSVGTPPEGITAEVLVVKDFDDLEAHADQIPGRIVAYNQGFENYGQSVAYRGRGAARASKLGAVAALVQSAASFSINSPHTGNNEYEAGVENIPVASITVEDAEMMSRMQERGQKIMVHLVMGAENLEPVVSQNTIVEVEGYDQPQKVVTVGGHLDSWDVGQGAMDDGGGVFISWNALVVLRDLDLVPRRTVRSIFYTGEEQGLFGGYAYYDAHSAEADNFQLILESDGGTFNPRGISFSGNDEATCIMQEVVNLTHVLQTTEIERGGEGPDIGMWIKEGVPIGSLINDNDRYFWFHHSDADTMSVEDSDTLDRCTALWTAVAYVTADMNIDLPHT